MPVEFVCRSVQGLVQSVADGEVAEWLKATSCKERYTVKSRIGGSNPSPLRQTFLFNSMQDLMHITVCICTFKRPGLLRRLLDELAGQVTEGRFTYSIVVADNDRLRSAEGVVSDYVRTSPVSMVYCVEPEQNIALVRNRALANARGDFIAFIDDDEFPANNWLLNLFNTCHGHKADGVLGPVKPYFEQPPPKWLIRGKFCDRPEHKTGTVLDWRETRTGNVLIKRTILNGLDEPFRRMFGSGAEDCDFFRRMIEVGRVFIWCNEAVVNEIVPPERWRRSYLVKKALLQGQNQRHLADFKSVAKSLVAIPVYAILLPVLLLVGQHAFMRYLLKLLDHTGKLVSLVGLKPLGDKYLAG